VVVSTSNHFGHQETQRRPYTGGSSMGRQAITGPRRRSSPRRLCVLRGSLSSDGAKAWPMSWVAAPKKTAPSSTTNGGNARWKAGTRCAATSWSGRSWTTRHRKVFSSKEAPPLANAARPTEARSPVRVSRCGVGHASACALSASTQAAFSLREGAFRGRDQR
jgi:hypothetical protein